MTSARPRVIHIITALNEGGAERQLELLTPRQDADVAVLTLYGGGTVADAIRAHGVRVIEFPLQAGPKALAWFRLARVLRRERPDVVHVHLLAAQLWGIPAARLARVPVVVSTEHSLNDQLIEGRPLTLPLRLVYWCLARLATITMAVSAETAGVLRRWHVPDRRVGVVDNGIDFDQMRFRPDARERVRAEFGLSPQTRLIGGVGRLHVSKRFAMLLRSLAPLLGDSTRLVIVGEGPEGDQLRAVCRELGIERYVVFTGARGDVPDLYSAMDAFVSLGIAETFGLAIIEAVAAGLPTVYAMCPALVDMGDLPKTQAIGMGDGAAAEARVRAAVEVALDQAAGAVDPAVAGAPTDRSAPAALVARYGIDVTAARLDEIYRRALAARASGTSVFGRAARRSPRPA